MTPSGEPPCFNLPVGGAVTVFLGLGTNVGDRAANLEQALRRIDAVARVEAVSSIYETEPVGYREQPDFWNIAARCTTELPAQQLMAELLQIELAMGRQRTFKNAPRLIDIDILLYDDVIMSDRDLELPHPRMHERAFVLRPLVEIAPGIEHPRSGVRYAELLARVPDARVSLVAPPIRVSHETL